MTSTAFGLTIAGAVAREIEHIAASGEHYAEGTAYKAAWDRRGSAADKHHADMLRDCRVIEMNARLQSAICTARRHLLLAVG